MGAIRAIHIISTTYGTWLPGDPAKPGHWSALYDMYGSVREHGGQLNLPDAATYEVARARMVEEPKILDEYEQRVVAQTMRVVICGDGCGGCVEEKNPPKGGAKYGEKNPPKGGAKSGDEVFPRCRVLALAIEATHFHLLIGPMRGGEPIGRFVGRLKGRTSSAVLALSGNSNRKRVWANGYWKVFLFDDAGVRTVREYIENHHVRRGLPANPHADWVG